MKRPKISHTHIHVRRTYMYKMDKKKFNRFSDFYFFFFFDLGLFIIVQILIRKIISIVYRTFNSITANVLKKKYKKMLRTIHTGSGASSNTMADKSIAD